MWEQRDALRLQQARARDVAFSEVQALQAMRPDVTTGGAVQTEVWGCWDPDTSEWVEYFVFGLHTLGDEGTTLGPG